MKVIVFYIEISRGHRRAAEAVCEALRREDASTQTACVDFFRLLGGAYQQALSHVYLGLIRRRPSWWERLYDRERYASSVGLVRDWLAGINEEKIAHFLRAENPDSVVCTQAVPAVVAGGIKEREKENLPFKLYAGATDFTAHLYWNHPGIDRYFVASEYSIRRLAKRGVDPRKITPSGIPIHPDFEKAIPRNEAKKSFGWEKERPVVLLMGGSLGMGISARMVELLLMMPVRARIVVLTGENKDLRMDLERLESSLPAGRDLVIHSTVDEISRLMRASDVILSKPGGLTMAEAMACALPMVAVNPLPGQERRNAKFLERAGAGVYAEDQVTAVRHVERILRDDRLRESLSVSAGEAGRPQASRRIARLVLGKEVSP